MWQIHEKTDKGNRTMEATDLEKNEIGIRKCDWSSWKINHRIHKYAGKDCI